MPFSSFTDMLRLAPELLRLKCYRTVYGEVARHVRSEKLREVLSFHPLLIGGNPFSVTSIYCLIAHLERRWGVHFAMGGTGSLVQGLVRLIEGQGGTLRCNAAVSEIVVEDGKAAGVELADGTFIAADIVVSNADSASTYRNLLPSAHRRRWTDRKIDSARYSMSLFVWYFGTRRKYPDVPHHTIMLGTALSRSCWRTSSAASRSPKTSASICTGRPRPIRRSRRTAATPSTCFRRCRICKAASTGRRPRNPIARADRAPSERDHAAGPRRRNRHVAPSDAAGLSRIVCLRSAALPSGLSRCCRRVPGSGRTTRAKKSNISISSAPARIPVPGLPGVLSSARILDKVVPDAVVFADR